jgi:putative phosphoribosyl transferase
MFRDRADAGRQLAQMLAPYAAERPVIVALPRGGVVVGFEAARALRAPLEILVVRKLGAPRHEELAIGAVVDAQSGGEQGERTADAPLVVLDQELIGYLQVPPGYIASETMRQIEEIRRRERAYRGGRAPLALEGRMVILIDDGIATGSSTRAALRALRERGPARLILGVPVAAPESLRSLSREADEVVCVIAPSPFGAVGAFYENFAQTTDDEVIDLLERSRQWASAA